MEDERTLELLQLALDSIEEGDAKWMGGSPLGCENHQKQHDVSFLAWGPFRSICKYHKFPKVVARLYGPQWLSIFNGPGKYSKNSFPVAEFVWSKGPEAQQYPKHPSRATEDPKWHMRS